LFKDGLFFCFTVEPVVPIPAGKYTCTQTPSPRLGIVTYELQNVTGHDGIRIHRMNVFLESRLCIGIGLRMDNFNHSMIEAIPEEMGTIPGVSFSGDAFTMLMNAQDGDFELEII
jgi:hypothetical protein